MRRSILEGSHLATSEVVALFHRANADDHSKRFSVMLESRIRGGADKSLARLNSRCRRTESIVSLERGACSCAELQVFSCYRG